jgi:hypothetical protein
MKKPVFIGVRLVCLILVSCAHGPIKTHTEKNIPIAAPREFQSPFSGINQFTKLPLTADHSLRSISGRARNILIEHEKAVENELSSTNQLLLKSGYSYEFELETFCVHAGIERPVEGDGLFLGNLEGAPKSWLPQILNGYKKSGISQIKAQLLIWSLLAGTKFNELNSENKTNILKLFPDAPIRFGNSVVENWAKSTLLSQLPEEIITAKNKLEEYRDILQDSQRKFLEIESILAPASTRQEPILVGWLKHEDGYYIQLKSNSYNRIHVQIYAPQNLKSGTYFIPSNLIAVPGVGQRLALSANAIKKTYDDGKQVFKDKTSISPREATFIAKHPIDTFKIYEDAQKALKITRDNMKSSNGFEDDRSDAFRHFVWSCLVTHDIGLDKAREYLEAHEDFPENKPDAKAMDIYNNNQGIEFGSNYKGNDIERDIVKEALEKIKNRELKWIK